MNSRNPEKLKDSTEKINHFAKEAHEKEYFKKFLTPDGTKELVDAVDAKIKKDIMESVFGK